MGVNEKILTTLNVLGIFETLNEAVESIVQNENNIFLLDDMKILFSKVKETLEKQNVKEFENIISQLNEIIKVANAQKVDFSNLKSKIRNILLNYIQASKKYIFSIVVDFKNIGFINKECLDGIDEYMINTSDYVFELLKAIQSGYVYPKKSYDTIMSLYKKYLGFNKIFTSLERENYKEFNNIKYTEDCPMCNTTGEEYFCAFQYIAVNYENMFQPAKLWLKCPECGVIFAYNFPQLEKEAFVGCDVSEEEERMAPRYSLGVFANIMENIKKYTTGLSMVDVGIGNGELLLIAQEMGFAVTGVEISRKEASKAIEQLDLNVVWSDFLEFEPDETFDVITMGDIIEHVSSPRLALEKAAKLLSKNGILWLSTPNYNSAFSKYKLFVDPMWNEPWHYTYFSKEVLMPYLNEYGFELLQYNVSARYNGSMELILKKV